ncbi:MAG: DUF2798 domain-containing protein [Ruminococcus sp.]
MPKTKFQSLIFTILMVFVMVFCMTVYTIARKNGELTYAVFLTAIQEMWVEYVLVFLLVFFIVSKVALILSRRIVDPQKDNPFFFTIMMQSLTVAFVVPTITLFATFLHNGFTGNWFVQWITLAVQCFPMAFFLQIFFAGPLVRFLFRNIFRERSLKNKIPL